MNFKQGVKMRYLIFVFFILTAIGCSTDNDKNTPESIFAVPNMIEETETDVETQYQPLVPETNPLGTIVAEPENKKLPDRVFDIFPPKLLKSTVKDRDSEVNIHLNSITLFFDENVAKSNIQIRNLRKQSLRWKRIINGKNIILTPLGNVIDLAPDKEYSISGIVEDKDGNTRAILINFTTEKIDKSPPIFTSTNINHGDININPERDVFTFGFNEDIGDAVVKITNKINGRDLRWTQLIRGKEIILHKLDRGLRLQGATQYRIHISWADESGNWNPGGVIDFTTKIPLK